MSGLEIERKFLVRNDKDFKHLAESSHRISQGYIPAEGATVRVRMRDDTAFLTIKSHATSNGLTRYEFEKEITFKEAVNLMRLCKGGCIEKTRYIIPFEGNRFEVDEFYGANEGLVLAEIELENEQQTFKMPDFIGKEVTADPRFRNARLLTNPFSQWVDQIPPEYIHPPKENQ